MRRLIIICVLLVATTAHADALLDEWYADYKLLKDSLNTEVIIDEGYYQINLDYENMAACAASMTKDQLLHAASIAHEMKYDVEMPAMREVYTKEGSRKLAKAIITLESETIIRMVKTILDSDRLNV